MPAVVRRTSTKVVNGRVTRKNRSAVSEARACVIEKLPAGRGFKHVVSPRQLQDFIALIPDWPDLSHRLERIELSGGHLDYFGFQSFYRLRRTGMIALCAWSKNLWNPLSIWFFRHHRPVLEKLGVPYRIGLASVTCEFSIAQARAFSLLHVFMHEVGHHHDWLHRRGPGLPDVEAYAENFANRYFDTLWPLYTERFGDPAEKSPDREHSDPSGKA